MEVSNLTYWWSPSSMRMDTTGSQHGDLLYFYRKDENNTLCTSEPESCTEDTDTGDTEEPSHLV